MKFLYPRDMTYSDQMKFLKKNKFYHVTHITTKTLDLKYLEKTLETFKKKIKVLYRWNSYLR